MPQFPGAGAGFLTWPRARATFYGAALAVFLASSTLGSTPLADASQSEAASPEATAEPTSAEAVDPFVQEEVTFRYLPSISQLLLGEAGEASATVLLATGCANSNKGTNLAMAGGEIVMAPSNPASPAQLLTPAPVDLDSDLPDGGALPLCPVTLSTTAMRVGDSSHGWLLWVTSADGDVVAEQASVPYTVRRIIHWSGYVLLAVSAALVAFGGLLSSDSAKYAKQRKEQQDPAAKADPLPTLPVMASILGALTAVATGALLWTDLVPGMDLGGVVVIGLIGGVLVAAGDRLSVTYQDSVWRAPIGLLLSLFGTVTIALLLPFVLLHGATIGGWSTWAWIAVAGLLMLASLVRLPQDPAEASGQAPLAL